MKKSIRAVLLLLTIALLLPSLTSCLYVEELKARRADWADDLRIDLVVDGQIYKPLLDFPKDTKLYLPKEDYGYAVDADLPLLLLYDRGTYFDHDGEKRFLSMSNRYYPEWGWTIRYCRADLHESMIERMANVEFTSYYTEYYAENEENGAYENNQLILTPEQVAAFNALGELDMEIGESAEIVMNENAFDRYHFYPCSEDGLFVKATGKITFYSNTALDLYYLCFDASHLIPVSDKDIFRALAEQIEEVSDL